MGKKDYRRLSISFPPEGESEDADQVYTLLQKLPRKAKAPFLIKATNEFVSGYAGRTVFVGNDDVTVFYSRSISSQEDDCPTDRLPVSDINACNSNTPQQPVDTPATSVDVGTQPLQELQETFPLAEEDCIPPPEDTHQVSAPGTEQDDDAFLGMMKHWGIK